MPEPADGKDADPCAPDVSKAPEGITVHNVDKDQSQQVWIGVIPTRELRLGGDRARDGWGNEFTYAVSRRLTLPLGMHGNPTPYGNITVVNENRANVLDKPDSGRYVIVSHGPSGSGAWTSQGGRRPCREGTLASQNCDGNAVFVVAPFALRPGPTFYDNIVVYDDPNANGSMIDRVVICNAKLAFWIPSAPQADQDGCVFSVRAYRNLLAGRVP